METKKELVAIAMLLKQPRPMDVVKVQRAAEAAFREAPVAPKVVALKSGNGFGILLGPMRLGVLCVSGPYFKDIANAADRVANFAGKQTIQQSTAWMSVDLIEAPPQLEREMIYTILGTLVAELLKDKHDVLGLVRLPGGPVVGYDPSFIP